MSAPPSQDPAPAAATPDGRASDTTIRRTFAALGHRNYRFWFAGQLVSLFGTWMQSTAQGFLVYELTRSPAYLGYVGFAAGLPSWLFMLYGGVMSDRMSRRKLLVITQTAMMLLAAVLATLAFTGAVRPWHILVLASGLGLANAFDAPARQAFVLELVDREDLTNAIALNSTMFNTATAAGPALAGITYDLFGPGWCFALNAVSFLAVIFALLCMRLPPFQAPNPGASARGQLTEALGYVRRDKVVRTLIVVVALTSCFGFGFITVLPAWAVSVLHGSARTNGLMHSARGAGAMVAALAVAALGTRYVRGRLLSVGTLALPTSMMLFAVLHTLPGALVTMALVGASLILVNSLSNALVQTSVPDELRGRVMAVYTLTFFGLMPIGALTTGALAERLGEPIAVATLAALLGLASLFAWLFVPRLRRLP